MDPIEFIKSIYLGDRSCRKIIIDSSIHSIKIMVDCISRVRGELWNYYTSEDIENGYIVFRGVTNFSFDPQGVFPDDYIWDFSVEKIDDGCYLFTMVIDSIGNDFKSTNVYIKIYASEVFLEDSKNPGILIQD